MKNDPMSHEQPNTQKSSDGFASNPSERYQSSITAILATFIFLFCSRVGRILSSIDFESLYCLPMGNECPDVFSRPGTVFCLGTDGSLVPIACNMNFPNGIAVTYDGKTLFVAETNTRPAQNRLR